MLVGQGRPPLTHQHLPARAAMSYTARGRGRNAMDRAHVGIFIRRGRALRRQPYHARPWTQDELAFAIGTDPAHISRIEGGKIVPSRSTIDRIALAFELTAPQHALLLGLAGYTPE